MINHENMVSITAGFPWYWSFKFGLLLCLLLFLIFCSFCIAFWCHFCCTLSLPFLLGNLSVIICQSIFLHQQKKVFVFVTLSLFLYDCIYCNDVIHCWSVFLSCSLHIGHVAFYCFILDLLYNFIMLWTLYLLIKCLFGFHDFFLLSNRLCIVTLLIFLSIVMVSVFLP